MAIKWKTWSELLGQFNPKTDSADGRRLVRYTGKTRRGANRYLVLWTFDTEEQTAEALTEWQQEKS